MGTDDQVFNEETPMFILMLPRYFLIYHSGLAASFTTKKELRITFQRGVQIRSFANDTDERWSGIFNSHLAWGIHSGYRSRRHECVASVILSQP